MLGAEMKNDSITAATGEQGDCDFVLGFANDEYMAKNIVEEYGMSTAALTLPLHPWAWRINPLPMCRFVSRRRRNKRRETTTNISGFLCRGIVFRVELEGA